MSDNFRKVLRDKPFTALDNETLRDPELSLKARGLLVTCLSLPPDWRFSIRGLVMECKDGRAAIESALDELEAAGYLRRSRVQEHNENGTFGGTLYTFYEVRQSQPCAENQHTVEAPQTSPCAENPHAENLHAENQQQQIKEQQKKEQQIPPKPPRGRAAAKKAPDHLPEEFARLWTAYPRGEDKQGAIAEWDRLKPDEATVFAMQMALLAQKQTDEWQRGIGIPYFVRWLRHRRWEDDKLRTSTPGAGLAAKAPAEPYEPEVRQWQ